MFKNKGKLNNFVKRQIAKILAIVMAFTSFASTGLALTSVYGAEEYQIDYGQEFVKQAVKITADGTPYIWGGWLNPGVDCRGLVRAALSKAYSQSIYKTQGYWVDDAGNAVLDKNGNRQYIDVAQHGNWILPGMKQWEGRRICVEGTTPDGRNIRTYYRVLVADYTKNVSTAADIELNGSKYSSIIAYACQFPGSIICHNGHYGLALGAFDSEAEFLAKYDELDMKCSGTYATENDRVTRWSESAYNLGNTYSPDEYGYWFGKTMFLSACSPTSGIRADNFTTTGKTSNPDPNSELVILIAEQAPAEAEIVFTKYDTAAIARGEDIRIPGAIYQIYYDAACTKPVSGGEFKTSTDTVTVKLPKGMYYVKEKEPPTGYQISNQVIPVDTTKVNLLNISLYDNPVNSTVLVQKVDALDPSIMLSDATFTILEYSEKSKDYQPICDLRYVTETQAYTLPTSYRNRAGEQFSDGTLHFNTDNMGLFIIKESKTPSGYFSPDELNEDEFEQKFDITKGALRLIGTNAVKNQPKFSLTIKKTDETGNKALAGAKFQCFYNGEWLPETFITNANGEFTIVNLPATTTMSLILKEIEAPNVDGVQYVPLGNLSRGETIVLEHTKISATTGCYHTEKTFKNYPAQTEPAVNGTIKFKKTDLSRFPFNVGIQGAIYALYTDPQCQPEHVATDLNGNPLGALITGADGSVTVTNLALGTYYLKEVMPYNSYGISPRVFTINLIDDGSAPGGTIIEELPIGIVSDPKQTVTIEIEKVDSLNPTLKVPNAIYALYNETEITTSFWGETINAGTLLGYCQTDANGKLSISNIGHLSEDIGSEYFIKSDGTRLDQINFIGKSGMDLNGEALVNGVYRLVEIDAPYGYTLGADIIIDASYKFSVEDKVSESNGVTTKLESNSRFMTISQQVVETRQTVQITLNKSDVLYGSNTNGHYGLDTYQQAVTNGLAATLVGARYRLVANSDIIDPYTNMIIPKGTTLGIYTIGDTLSVIIDKMNQKPYENRPIPNGEYMIEEIDSPFGYAINTSKIAVSAPWTCKFDGNGNQESIDLVIYPDSVKSNEEILKQAITIQKFDEDGNALEGAVFAVYSVAEIYEKIYKQDGQYPASSPFTLSNATGLDGRKLLNRDEFKKLIDKYGLTAISTNLTTNGNGIVETPEFVFGDYIVYETLAPTGHIASDAMYVQLPWEAIGSSGSSEDDGAGDQYVEHYKHDVDASPTSKLFVTVWNTKTRVDFSVEKIWEDFDNRYDSRTDVLVELYANGVGTGKTLTLSQGNNWTGKWSDLLEYGINGQKITYSAIEISAVPGYDNPDYVHTESKTTITNTYNPSTTFTITKVWKDNNNELNKRVPSISARIYIGDDNNKQYVGDPVTLSASNGWTVTIDGLRKIDANSGNIIQYKVEEITQIPGYHTTIRPTVNGGEIINECLTNFTVIKVWNDRDNIHGVRPKSIDVYLYANGDDQNPVAGPLTLNAANGWSAEWTDLKAFDEDENLINYFVKEVPVEHYESNVEGGLITNTCILTTLYVDKYEMVNGEKVPVVGAQLKLVDENGDDVFDYLDNKCEWVSNGQPHKIVGLNPGKYTLVEVDAPNGYAKSENKTFTVSAGLNDQFVDMENKKIIISIDKVSAENSDLKVIGAQLSLFDSTGKQVVDANNVPIIWTTDGQKKIIAGLDAGTYYIRELRTPTGYQALSNDIEIVVQDSAVVQEFTVENETTLGTIEVHKNDSLTGSPLFGVEFELISLNKVVDPITKAIIYEAGDVVATLKTDENGIAKLNEDIPILVYNADGTTTPIEYKLIEIKAAAGAQYDPHEIEVTFVIDYIDGVNDKTPVILKTFDLTNDKPIITVEKTSGIPFTFEGQYEHRHDVTIVKNGDKLEYVITVKNEGSGDAYNIIVKDKIPANAKFISATSAHNAIFDPISNTVYWTIDKIEANLSEPEKAKVELRFIVEVTNDKACEIVNIAQWAMPDKFPENPEDYLDPMTHDDWNYTNEVVHQVVEFHKSSTVVGGTNKDNATAVSPGDTIKYHLSFKALSDVHNLLISDKIQEGLTYINGSATINGQKCMANYDAEDRILFFPIVTMAGMEVVFEFEVTVDPIEIGAHVDYANTAYANFSPRGDDEPREIIESETVTHFAESKIEVEKHGTPKTYEGNRNEAKDITVVMKDEKITYTITVNNVGKSDVHNIVVKDSVPDGTTLINDSVDGAKFWIDENGIITWLIDEIEFEESVDLTFDVVVNEQKAQLIINQAEYGDYDDVGDEIPEITRPYKTNDVVHQVVEFHKSSQIKGGIDLTDAVVVNVGDTITYMLEVINHGDLYNVSIVDKIPDGLKFKSGSLQFKHVDDSNWTDLLDDQVIVSENNETVALNEIMLKTGKNYLKFDVIVEHVAVNTEKSFVNQAVLTFDKYANDDSENPEREDLLSETVSHMTSVKIEGEKTGEIETYVGSYEHKNHVTVVIDNEKLVYTIEVKNTGLSDIKNLVIKDILPKQVKFDSADHNGKYDETTGEVTWIIDSVKAGDSVMVQIVVIVDTDGKAEEIRNIAKYAVPEDIENINENEWNLTEEVIHQTLSIVKDASIEHGFVKEDAVNVEIGKQFQYTIALKMTNTIYGLTMKDAIPTGLKFIDGTAWYQINESEKVFVKDVAVDDNNLLTFPTLDSVESGEITFGFDVLVEDVAEYDTAYYYINIATADINTNENSEDFVTLITNTISNVTAKQTPPTTPAPPADEPPKTGDESNVQMFAITAVLSAFGAISLGIYGFSQKKKSSK